MGISAILSDPAFGGVAAIAAVVSTAINVIQLVQNRKLKSYAQSLSSSGSGNIAQNTSGNSTAIAHAGDVTISHGSNDK